MPVNRQVNVNTESVDNYLKAIFALSGPEETRVSSTALAERLGVPCVASGNVHVHDRSRAPLQDVFFAVRTRTTLHVCESLRCGNTAHALMSDASRLNARS